MGGAGRARFACRPQAAMTEPPPPVKSERPAATERAREEKAARIEREAEALRKNLRRRKEQQRARAVETPGKGGDTSPE